MIRNDTIFAAVELGRNPGSLPNIYLNFNDDEIVFHHRTKSMKTSVRISKEDVIRLMQALESKLKIGDYDPPVGNDGYYV